MEPLVIAVVIGETKLLTMHGPESEILAATKCIAHPNDPDNICGVVREHEAVTYFSSRAWAHLGLTTIGTDALGAIAPQGPVSKPVPVTEKQLQTIADARFRQEAFVEMVAGKGVDQGSEYFQHQVQDATRLRWIEGWGNYARRICKHPSVTVA